MATADSIPLVEPFAIAGVLAALTTAVYLATTPWSVRLPRQSDAGWPALSPAARRSERLTTVGVVLRVIAPAVVLALLLSGPGSRQLHRWAPTDSGARLGVTCAGVMLVVGLARLPGSALTMIGARARTSDPGLSWTWWWRRSLFMSVYFSALVGGVVLPGFVRDLHDDAAGAWGSELGVVISGAVAGLLLGPVMSRRRLRNPTEPQVRYAGSIARVLPRTGITREVRFVVAKPSGPDPAGLALGGRKPVVAVGPQWSESLPDVVMDGLLAHELAHVARDHPRRRAMRVLLLFGTVATATVALACVPVVRRTTHSDGNVDVRFAVLLMALAGLLGRAAFTFHLWSVRHEEAEADQLALAWSPPDGTRPFLGHLAALWQVAPRSSGVLRLACACHPDWVDRVGPLLPATLPAIEDVPVPTG